MDVFRTWLVRVAVTLSNVAETEGLNKGRLGQ